MMVSWSGFIMVSWLDFICLPYVLWTEQDLEETPLHPTHCAAARVAAVFPNPEQTIAYE